MEKSKCPFRVGDHIIAKPNGKYTITANGWKGVVRRIYEDGTFCASPSSCAPYAYDSLDPNCFYLDPKFHSESLRKVIIYAEDTKVIAKLVEGKKLIRTASAKCSPTDKFCFDTGAKLALYRLFEEVPTRCSIPAQCASFGQAIEWLKEGKRVSRKGWNGNGQWLALQNPDCNSKMQKPYIYISPTDGELVPWLATQTDMLANDWYIV